MDSDDECLPGALDLFASQWDEIQKLNDPSFAGVSGLCVDQNGKIIGDPFPQYGLDSNSLELKYKYQIRGEKWGVIRTDVVREYPFPTLRVRNIPESIVWSRIARNYKIRFINEPVRIYHATEASLIRVDDIRQIAPSAVLQHEDILNYQMDYFRYAPAVFLNSAVHFSRFSLHEQIPLNQQLRKIRSLRAKLLWGLCLPMGWLVYYKDRIQSQ